MKKLVVTVILLFIIVDIDFVYAQRGCCSHHGGVAGCSSNGRQICNDGTLSPSCTCTPTITYINGCMDNNAKNYNPEATKDDGSCIYYKYGCTNVNSINYDETVEKDDGSCIPIIYGCTDSTAKNYNADANTDDGTCIQFIYGCMDSTAKNYNKDANTDDKSCIYETKDKNNRDNDEENSKNNDNEEIVGVGSAIFFLQYIVGHVSAVGYCILEKVKK